MITMDLREAIQLQSVYGPGTGAYALVADLGQARDSVLRFLCAPILKLSCPECQSTNIDANMRDEAGPIFQCRDCGRITAAEGSR